MVNLQSVKQFLEQIERNTRKIDNTNGLRHHDGCSVFCSVHVKRTLLMYGQEKGRSKDGREQCSRIRFD